MPDQAVGTGEDGVQSPPKRRRGSGKTLPLVLGLLLGAGITGGGLFAFNPDLLGGRAAGAGSAPKEAEKKGPAEYFALQQPFTSNLKDSAEFVQLSVSLGTSTGEKFLEALKIHETALRSVILLAVADQTYASISTPEGKRGLALKLRRQLNDTLKERGEAPGIETVYFTAFVIQ